ncbi:MAG: hypothetical protein GKS00_05285 [Alphaproteobacteria bacterium]|nr:hypothetical protein [Alphaproteobacteria bacterium]
MKHHTSLLATTIYCGVVTAASAMLLNGAPTDPLDPGFASFSNFFAEFGGRLNLSDTAERVVSADPEPGILALMSISLAGFSVADGRRTLRLRDAGVALGLLIYLAPLFAIAAMVVRLSGPGPLLQQREAFMSEGQRVWLLSFRTAPSSHVRRWQSLLLAFLHVTRVASLPVLVNVMRGEIELRAAAKVV